MNNHKVVLTARVVKEGELVSRWLERKASFMNKIPADGILIESNSVNVPPMYIRKEDIEKVLKGAGEEIELVSWGDDATILPYS